MTGLERTVLDLLGNSNLSREQLCRGSIFTRETIDCAISGLKGKGLIFEMPDGIISAVRVPKVPIPAFPKFPK